MSEKRTRLRKQFVENLEYPSGSLGWELFLVDRISALGKVAEALVEIMPNLEMSYAIKTKQYNELEELLRAAGYLKEGGE